MIKIKLKTYTRLLFSFASISALLVGQPINAHADDDGDDNSSSATKPSSNNGSKYKLNYSKLFFTAYSRSEQNDDRSWSSGYLFRANVGIEGPVNSSDSIKIVWKDGKGKELGKATCKINVFQEEGSNASYASTSDCGYEELKRDPTNPNREKKAKDWLKYSGLFEADIFYIHSDGDKNVEEKIATAKGKMGKFWSWHGKDRIKNAHLDVYKGRYLPLGNGLLGSSIISMEKVDPIGGFGNITLRFWASRRNENEGKAWLTCKANDSDVVFFKNSREKSDQTKEIEVTLGSDQGYLMTEEHYTPQGTDKYTWIRYKALVNGLVYGTQHKDSVGTNHDSRTNLSDYGNAKWACTLRYAAPNGETKAVRKFSFQVKMQDATAVDGRKVKQGLIVPHEEQIEGGLYLGPGKVLVDTEFPNVSGGATCDNGFDFSIQANDIKSSGFYGRPWKSKKFQELWKGLKSCGQSEPAPIKGAAHFAK